MWDINIKGGQGGKIERLFREARVYSVFAGSEEVMLDLGVRQAARQYKGAPKL
jgi:alkylation response protein AidB-like acyl-CoA dehydrogenase